MHCFRKRKKEIDNARLEKIPRKKAKMKVTHGAIPSREQRMEVVLYLSLYDIHDTLAIRALEHGGPSKQ